MDGLFGRLADIAFALITPPRCRACGEALFDHANPYLCAKCLEPLLWIGDGACRGCGYPAGKFAKHREHCRRCRDGKLRLTGAAGVVRYRSGAKNLVKAMKFRGETRLVNPMADLMAERCRQADFHRKADCIMPVALHDSRRRERGFDQARLLAAGVGKRTGLPVRHGVLKRVRPTPPQALLRRAERLRNLEGAFHCADDLRNAKILLVDDVMTTGATMAECARACREAGASRVYALTFAR